jgi:hypothetical protein
MKAAFLCLIASALPLAAQSGDFLTADETEQVRLAQEPNERLKLYALFAKQRVDMLKDLLSKDKSGRSVDVRETLDQYTRIIDAIDSVADDALERKADIKTGLAAVAKAEREMLPILEKVQQSAPEDLDRYQFALKNAIDTTSDSLELSEEDLNQRAKGVEAKAAKERKELEGMMQPKDLEAKKAQEKKAAAEEKKQRKPPTLKRKGEQ